MATRNAIDYPRIPDKGVYIKGTRSIDGATGDIAQDTNAQWIEDAKYGWMLVEPTEGASAEFDSAITRTGNFTIKLSHLDTDARGFVISAPWVPGVADLLSYGFRLKPSTEYTLNVYAKTDSVAADSVYAGIYEYDFAAVSGTGRSTNRLTGTNDWTLLTVTFTSNADAVWGVITLRNYIGGAISDAWFDVNSMTLVKT